ncbi:hypothetical protein D3C80_1873190 [compost metagenome]
MYHPEGYRSHGSNPKALKALDDGELIQHHRAAAYAPTRQTAPVHTFPDQGTRYAALPDTLQADT